MSIKNRMREPDHHHCDDIIPKRLSYAQQNRLMSLSCKRWDCEGEVWEAQCSAYVPG